MKHVLALLVVLISSGIGCKNNPVGPAQPAEIWPLKPGNEWLYFVHVPYLPSFLDTLRIKVSGTQSITFEQQTYQAVKLSYSDYSEEPPDHQWLTWSGPDGVYGLGGVASTDTLLVKYLWFKYPAEVGDKWFVPSVYFSRDRKEFYVKDTLTYSVVAKDEVLETPAGKFKCYVYEFIKWPEDDVPDNWHHKYYYSPGVGLVGLITTSENENGTVKEKLLLWTYSIKR